MRAIMESLFDIAYLVGVFVLAIKMIQGSKSGSDIRLYGIMSLVLVCGDAFHLVPRIVGLNSPLGLDGFTAALGIGKLVTSITMTVFYVMLYRFWTMHFKVEQSKNRDLAVYVLAAARIALCLFPQNAWTSADSPVSWGIYRNIPFVILGVMIIMFFANVREQDRHFRNMAIAITLSFLFYIPVVLWADVSPMIGMLMLPKTCCYVWMVVMGLKASKAA